MESFSLEELEFPALRRLLAARTQTPQGRLRAENLVPASDREEIVRQQRLTGDAVRYFRAHAGFGLGGLGEITLLLELLRIENTRLEPVQFLELIRWIEAAQSLRLMFSDLTADFPELAALSRRIPDLGSLARRLSKTILPTGEIDDQASDTLRETRRDAHRLRERIQRRLRAVLRESPEAAIQDDVITLRNERFVVPVRASHRREIPGVVHALSGSGATVFIEPLETIDANNELIRLLEMEQAEIARLLLELTAAVREQSAGLESLTRLVTEFDLLGAKARLAIDFDCVAPSVSDRGQFRWIDVRHPLLEEHLRRHHDPVVPVSLELDPEHRTLIISGPNAGGKTVVLKTVGLCTLMAQSGLQVPAREAEWPIFEQVLAEIGDRQSIAANLSTFTAHVQSIREVMEMLNDRALVLLDEVGTGTDPDEGACLAVSIVNHFHLRGAMTLATTHYHALKAYGYLTAGVINASVEFDEQKLRPTFRLLANLAGSSNGIEIARRVGLPDEIIEHALQLAKQSDQEARRFLERLKEELERQTALRMALENERAVTAEKYERLERDFSARDAARRKDLDARSQEVIDNLRQQADQLLHSIEEKRSKASLQKLVGRKIADLEASSRTVMHPYSQERQTPRQHTRGRELVAGDWVRIPSLGKTGRIETIDGEELTIGLGLLKWKARRDEVEWVEAPTPVAGLPAGVSVQIRPRANLCSELNLIGESVVDAVDRTDKFLDEAVLASLTEVRIVHGAGSGALRKAVRDLLSNHPHVRGFRSASPREGAGGATVVELRPAGE